MIRRLNMERLQNTLYAFFQPTEFTGEDGILSRFLGFFKPKGPGANEGGDR
jgi:hypothetical protein